MKKAYFVVCILTLSAILCGCNEKKIVHCDKCNKEISIDADSNMDEDWIIFCDECGDPALELFENN